MARKRDIPAATAEALIVLIGLGFVLLAGVVGWGLGYSTKGQTPSTVTIGATAQATSEPIDPHVAAGAHDFVQFACAQCHGMNGEGGVSPDVPALTTAGKALTVAQLTHIINHGLGESANPKKPYMPVWGAVSRRARSPTSSPTSAPASRPCRTRPRRRCRRARASPSRVPPLYVRYGCINCHGPNGLGGVPNPQSPDKAIPPLSGGGLPLASSTPTRRSMTSSAAAA